MRYAHCEQPSATKTFDLSIFTSACPCHGGPHKTLVHFQLYVSSSLISVIGTNVESCFDPENKGIAITLLKICLNDLGYDLLELSPTFDILYSEPPGKNACSLTLFVFIFIELGMFLFICADHAFGIDTARNLLLDSLNDGPGPLSTRALSLHYGAVRCVYRLSASKTLARSFYTADQSAQTFLPETVLRTIIDHHGCPLHLVKWINKPYSQNSWVSDFLLNQDFPDFYQQFKQGCGKFV